MFNALESIQAFEAGSARRKEREREAQMKQFGNALAMNDYGGAAKLGFQIDPALGMQARQYGESQNALDLNKKIAPMVASGDYAGAMNLAAPSGNLDLVTQLQQFKQTATEQQRKEAAYRAEQLAKVAIGYQGMAPEQAAARWQQDLPALQAQGFSAEELAQFDPSDPNDINDALLAAQTLSDVLEGQRADAAAKTDQERFDLTFGLDKRRLALAEKEAEDAAEARRLEAEAKAAEQGAPNVDDEGQFRREYNTITKDFRDVQAAFGRIRATDPNTAAGQISLVFQYMKMLDPGSTVREGEFATAENARGVPEGVMNTYNKIMAGRRLTPEQVADFKAQATQLYGQALDSYDTTRKTYEGIAQNYGFGVDRTVPDLATMRDYRPKTFLERGMGMLPDGTQAVMPTGLENATDDDLFSILGGR